VFFQENFPVHKASFISALIFSSLQQVMLVALLTNCHLPSFGVERRGYEARRKILATGMSSACLMIYFYMRHVNYCEPYVFSLFSLFEYIFVICNHAFHYATYHFDFRR